MCPRGVTCCHVSHVATCHPNRNYFFYFFPCNVRMKETQDSAPTILKNMKKRKRHTKDCPCTKNTVVDSMNICSPQKRRTVTCKPELIGRSIKKRPITEIIRSPKDLLRLEVSIVRTFSLKEFDDHINHLRSIYSFKPKHEDVVKVCRRRIRNRMSAERTRARRKNTLSLLHRKNNVLHATLMDTRDQLTKAQEEVKTLQLQLKESAQTIECLRCENECSVYFYE